MSEPVYYTPPKSHEDHIKKMTLWLTVFFVSLFVIALLFIVFADTLARQLPFSVEKRFVRPYEVMATYIFDEEPSTNEIEVKEYLNHLTQKLASHLDIPSDYQLEVHYIDNGTINAFATLGGHIFVFRGLIEAMPDENSLAMVLAHEIAHIKHRDPLAAMGRGFAIQLIYSFVSGDFSSGSDLAVEGSEIGLLHFSREQEQAADIQAIDALYKNYGHVEGFDTLFSYILNELQEQKINDDSEISLEEWLSTHPRLKKRIELLSKYARENDLPLSGTIRAIPQSLRTSIKAIKEHNRKL
jgi:predicted Zn-dependent protease